MSGAGKTTGFGSIPGELARGAPRSGGAALSWLSAGNVLLLRGGRASSLTVVVMARTPPAARTQQAATTALAPRV
ncbi:MAG: hypothetical protein WAK86_02125, partial [Pseudonocardiaceae bacterium]